MRSLRFNFSFLVSLLQLRKALVAAIEYNAF